MVDRLGEWKGGAEEPGTCEHGNCIPEIETPGEGDRYITVGRVRPSTGCTVQLLVQDLLVVDTGTEVRVLGMEQYNWDVSPRSSDMSL